MARDGFLGFERPGGEAGVRNKVLVLPTVACVNAVAQKIASGVRGATAVVHSCGCAQAGRDLEQTYRTLLGTAQNPNVRSVLLVGLGCEGIDGRRLADDIANAGKEVELLVVQELGYEETVARGASLVKRMVEEASRQRRKPCDLSALTVGVECGGSDATSAIAANPVVGYVADRLVDAGATVILSETTETIGAEHVLASRMPSEELRSRYLRFVRWFEERLLDMGVDFRGVNPSPGNIRGGITTLEEKSLGAVIKGGSRTFQEVLDYAERPTKRGLVFMNTPGYDVESVTGLVAGGSQLVLFTTGRGTPAGSPVSPVIKVLGNPRTYAKLKGITDFYAGTVVEGAETVEQAGERLLELVLEVASGRLTAAEVLGHEDYAIWRVGTSF